MLSFPLSLSFPTQSDIFSWTGKPCYRHWGRNVVGAVQNFVNSLTRRCQFPVLMILSIPGVRLELESVLDILDTLESQLWGLLYKSFVYILRQDYIKDLERSFKAAPTRVRARSQVLLMSPNSLPRKANMRCFGVVGLLCCETMLCRVDYFPCLS